jgi:hypothetical protein
MKTLVFFMLVFVSNSVMALSSDRHFQLKTATDDNNVAVSSISGGTLTISEDTLTLKLYGHKVCGTPTLEQPTPDCIVPTIVDYSLPISDNDGGFCGEMFYGEQNKMPVDGVHAELTVIDYTRAFCRMVFPNAVEATLTEKFINRITGAEVVITHVMTFTQVFNK